MANAHSGNTCRHVMHTHLQVIPAPGGQDAAFQGMSEQTAMFLVAVCIR